MRQGRDKEWSEKAAEGCYLEMDTRSVERGIEDGKLAGYNARYKDCFSDVLCSCKLHRTAEGIEQK